MRISAWPILVGITLLPNHAISAPVPIKSEPKALLTVDGTPTGSLRFGLSDLAQLQQVTAARNDHGRAVECTGVRVMDLLARVGLPTGDALRGSDLTIVIVATARDGYKVAFTLGELDTKLGNTTAVIASNCDGKPLGDEIGPYRLIFPDDQRGARSVRQLERLTITASTQP